MPTTSTTPTLDDLGRMSAAQLRTAIARIDDEATSLHLNQDGSFRDLDRTQTDRLESLIHLRSRAEVSLRGREQLEKHPGSLEMAFGGSPALVRTNHIPVVDCEQVLRSGGDQLRDQALRMLEAQGQDLPAASIDRVEKTVRSRLGPDNPNLDGEYVSRRILITESPEYRSAFQQVMTESHPLLTDGEIRAVRAFRELESRAMGEITAAAGGYGVPTLIDPTILLSSGAEAAPLLDAARVVPVTSNVWKAVTSAPVTFTFQTEAAVSTDASPTLTQPSITVHMARAFVPYSLEIGQDYPGFAQEMANLLSQGWTDLVATKTITGSGSTEPYGLLTRLDATAGSEVLVTTAGTVDAAMIFKVWNALPERFRTRAKWLMSVSQESNIRSFGASPSPSSYFTCDLTADGITRLNGRPTIITDSMPSFTGATSHANHAIVGDFSAYVIAMRQGLTVEAVPHVFQQQTAAAGLGYPTGQRGFFAWGRWGADSTIPGAFRLLNQT